MFGQAPFLAHVSVCDAVRPIMNPLHLSGRVNTPPYHRLGMATLAAPILT